MDGEAAALCDRLGVTDVPTRWSVARLLQAARDAGTAREWVAAMTRLGEVITGTEKVPRPRKRKATNG